VGFRSPKAVTRTHVPVDSAALEAGSHHGSTYYQLGAFIDAVRGRGPVMVSAEDGLRAVAIGAAAELSAREKRVVRLDEFG
jgi:predicted dehydrogenase